MGNVVRRSGVTAALVAALTLVMCGCTQAPPAETATPTPAVEPVFASDEEALAAAEKAYTDYLAMSDLIAQEGGTDPERIGAVATGEARAEDIENAARYSENGYFGAGNSTFDSIKLQSMQKHPPQVVAYLCLDVSDTLITDANGVTVIDTPNPARVGLEVTFDWNGDTSSLAVSGSDLWTGSDFC